VIVIGIAAGSGGGAGSTNKPVQAVAATDYTAISARAWKLVVKDPSAYAGRHFVIYGQVKQFDAATGSGTFRASVDGVAHRPAYGFVDYEDNVMARGDKSTLAKIVQDDLFIARVTVHGAIPYDTQIGGRTTVPELQVDYITVTDSAS
jgi:hypothetical protein